jgi:hypothetical protein
MDLRTSKFPRANLTYADFTSADLSNANLEFATLARAKFAGASVRGASFQQTIVRGFNAAQLYSTASYQHKNLGGINLSNNVLALWDFSKQDLSNASFARSTLVNTDFTGANLQNADFRFAMIGNAHLNASDLRGAFDLNLSAASFTSGATFVKNMIHPDGTIFGLDLGTDDLLVVRNDKILINSASSLRPTRREPIPVRVNQHFSMSDASVLQLSFDRESWKSLITFQAGVPVTLGGTLKLTFTVDADAAAQVGRTMRIFDWNGITPRGSFRVESPYRWDLSRLHTLGEVTLVAIPEPTTALLLLAAVLSLRRYSMVAKRSAR